MARAARRLTPRLATEFEQLCRDLHAKGWTPRAISDLTRISTHQVLRALGIGGDAYETRTAWGCEHERYLIRKGILP